MIVYRVECLQNADGPYYTNRSSLSGYASPSCPDPLNDGLPLSTIWNIDGRYGFASRDDLLDWFLGALHTLEVEGFCIRSYTVPSDAVEFGGKQLVFPSKYHTNPLDEWMPTDSMFRRAI